MSSNHSSDRRSFLRKTAVTTVGAGGLLASADPAAAASQTMTIEGFADGSDYAIWVTDPDATGGKLESGDYVDNRSNYSYLSGTVNDGDVDEFYYDGKIYSALLDGELEVWIDNPPTGFYSYPKVSGDDNQAYAFGVTTYLSKYDNCESHDYVYDSNNDGNDDAVDGDTGTDYDQYYRQGGFRYLAALSGGSVEYDPDI